ncbi:MAG: hypothetical protein ACI4RD_05325 [Kiritimatiellia bacterium]
MKLRLIDPESLIPDAHVAAEAAVRGVEALIIEHLRQKNDGTKPNRNGLPKTNYYADAAKNVEASVDGATVRVEINHPGLAMHYEGGTVYPKKKALALPIDPAVAGIWPSEYSQDHKLFKTPGGALGDAESGKILYILLPKATIPADKSVLPTDDETLKAAEEAVWEAFS